MDIGDKFSVLADEIRGETIAEIRNKLLPRLVSLDRELNEIKDILRVHTKIEAITNDENENKLSRLRKAILGFLKEKQLNMTELRELIASNGMASLEDEGDQSTVRGAISGLCKDKVILKTDERKRNAPYFINPNPPILPKYSRKPRKPSSDPIHWEQDLPEILKSGPKTTKEIMNIIASKYQIDIENKTEKYRLSNNLRYATFHQEDAGKIEKFRKDGILYLALPKWNQEKLKLN
jgi:hypothetical protein